MFSVDIDTGGTMTDTLISGGPQPVLIKVESTPHDVTVSFVRSLETAAAATGHDSLSEFLAHVDLIRWSSTITSNVLAQRTGPKLGLLVSAGCEDTLYADDAATTAQVMPSLVRREHVAGLPPAADRATIVALLKRLIDQGIRRINVSLQGAFPDNRREQEILRIIAEQFPDHYLGSVPALAGSDMLMRPDDMSRTFYALINAYVHNSLANSLFKAEDLVKVEHHWHGNVLVGHLNGGVARIGKTKAVDTIESGPLFGTHASAAIAAVLDLPRVLAIDIGGTTAKASAVLDGRIEMRPEGHFFGIPVRTPMPVLRSIALGGGSVATVSDGRLQLGPESMGAAPGPACYKLGGRHATLTDALVVLGLLSPTGFLDGRRVLDADLAATALARDVAQKRDLDVPRAARAVLDEAVDMMAGLARDTLAEAGHTAADGFVMFAYGGNGPMFATEIAERLGVSDVRLFALGTVFSAYGSAIADVLHVYERALIAGDASELGAAVDALGAQAARDLAGEGFDPARAEYAWELENADGGRVDAQGVGATAVRELVRLDAPTLLKLTARWRIERHPLPPRPRLAGDSLRGTRSSVLTPTGSLPVHAHAALLGHSLDGPLVVDGGTFTWYVGAGWTLAVDAHGDAVLTRRAGR